MYTTLFFVFKYSFFIFRNFYQLLVVSMVIDGHFHFGQFLGDVCVKIGYFVIILESRDFKDSIYF